MINRYLKSCVFCNVFSKHNLSRISALSLEECDLLCNKHLLVLALRLQVVWVINGLLSIIRAYLHSNVKDLTNYIH